MSGEVKKLTWGEKIAYAMGDCGADTYTALAGSFLVAYYTDTVHIAAMAIGTMMLIARVFDGVTDLIMGAIVDRTRTRWGKARPWVLWTAPFMVIGLIAMFAIPESMYGKNSALVYAYISYFLMNCIVYTANNLPYNTLLSRMTRDVQDRASAVSFRGVIVIIWMQMIYAVTAALVARGFGWGRLATIYSFVSLVMFLWCFLGCKEHIGVNEETNKVKVGKVPLRVSLPTLLKNPYFFIQIFVFLFCWLYQNVQTAAMYYYCQWILGDLSAMTALSVVTMITSVVTNFVFPPLVKRFRKRPLMLISSALLVLGSVIISLWGADFAALVAGIVIRGVALTWLWLGTFATTADIVDYGEWKTGIRAEGLISSCTSVGLKLGTGLGAFAATTILAIGGYDGEAVTQTPAALSSITFAFGWSCAICGVVLFFLWFFLNVDKYIDQIEHDLKAKAAGEASPAQQ